MNNTNNNISFTTFIVIVGVILMPLSKIGGVYAWPCGRIAVYICFSHIGSLCAMWLKGKLNRKWLVAVGIAAAICFEEKYHWESTPQFPMFIAGFCHGAIFLIVTNIANCGNILGAFGRFSVRLILGLYKLLISKEFGWKEIFVGQ